MRWFKQSFHEENVTNVYVPYHSIYRSTELRPFSTHPFIVWYGSYKYSFLPSYKFFLLTYHIY